MSDAYISDTQTSARDRDRKAGTLAATKGNKVLMAHADRLADQVKTLSARVRQLEATLKSQAEELSSNSPASSIAGQDMECCDVSGALGSLAIGANGESRYLGETAGSEYLRELLPLEDADWQTRESRPFGLPEEIIELTQAFPLGLVPDPSNKSMFLPYIPPKSRALELADIYYDHATWMYDPLRRGDFMESIIHPIYGDSDGDPNIDSIHSHRLSAFFILLAHGALNETQEDALSLAHHYRALSKAALSLAPLQQDASCATVQALFMHGRFLYDAERNSTEERWLLVGLCARLAQKIGLQRDSARWNLPPDEVQRRRVIFWELYMWDVWAGIVTGRPPSMCITHTDCQFPADLDTRPNPAGGTEFSYYAWKSRYTAFCLGPTVGNIFSAVSPGYQAILDIDKRIRQMPIPSHLQAPPLGVEGGRSWSASPREALQQCFTLCWRESTLLYIHRSYFAQAIRQTPDDPLKHKFAPSVLTIYRSACRIIKGLSSVYAMHPERVSEYGSWYFWSAIFSSCVVLGALVIDSPGCTLAREALQQLEEAIILYEEGSKTVRPPATLNCLQKLRQRANASLSAFNAGLKGVNFAAPHDPDAPDELAVLGGCNTVIQNRNSSRSPSSFHRPSSQQDNYSEMIDGSANASPSGLQRGLVGPHSTEEIRMHDAPFASTTYATGIPHTYPHTASVAPTLPADILVDENTYTTVGGHDAPDGMDASSMNSSSSGAAFVPSEERTGMPTGDQRLHSNFGDSTSFAGMDAAAPGWFAGADQQPCQQFNPAQFYQPQQMPFYPGVFEQEFSGGFPLNEMAAPSLGHQSTSPQESWRQLMADFGA
ncbi:hypothetical protein HGRIS_004804 [Hohenbuehelia grisea]|uniref:Xylanolytic transcriptional activator regulatory domain-containing protein n=1 Tax=Hohenbuehelia grisea TaxID=104357 RepID=A0ABR3JD14_9AGAR